MKHRCLTALVMAVLVLATVHGVVATPPPMGTPSPTTLDFDSSAQLAIFFTDILNKLPAQAFPTLHTQADLNNWVQEIVPYYAYDNIVDPTKNVGEWGGLKYPPSVKFAYYQDGEMHNHVLGTTNCLDGGSIAINARYANPDSPLYIRHDALLTLTHELAHAQGICSSRTTLDAENSAQLSALEVLATMVNKGNRLAFGPLINELRDMAMSSALYFAQHDNRMGDYLALEAQVDDNSTVDLAIFDKSMRYWQGDPSELAHILEAYNVVPLQQIVTNIHGSECLYEAPEYPVTHMRFSSFPCIQGVELPINMDDVWKQPLFIDDLSFVWDHATALGQDFYGQDSH